MMESNDNNNNNRNEKSVVEIDLGEARIMHQSTPCAIF